MHIKNLYFSVNPAHACVQMHNKVVPHYMNTLYIICTHTQTHIHTLTRRHTLSDINALTHRAMDIFSNKKFVSLHNKLFSYTVDPHKSDHQ